MKPLARAALGAIAAALLAIAAPAAAAPPPPPQGLDVHPTPNDVPAISFEDADGKEKSLADLKGKVVLLNLWATWCIPCRREMPTLDQLQAKLGGKDFEVVALSIDHGGPDPVRRFFGQMHVRHLGIYVDRTARAAAKVGAPGIPTTLLIDRDGREIARKVGSAEWAAADMVDFLRARIGGD